MKSILGLAAAACLLVGLTAERASADTLSYEAIVSGTLKKGNTDAGTFGGTFEFTKSGASLNLTAANITTSPSGGFTDQEYRLDNTAIHTLSTKELYLEISHDYWLKLVFDPKLFSGNEPGIKTNTSGEHQSGAGNRKVVSGTITVTEVAPVPEPSTIAVVAIAAPALLVYAQRRRRKGADAA